MVSSHRVRVDRLFLVIGLLALVGILVAPAALAADDDAASDNHIIITLGSQRQIVDGNSLRFRQYVTSPNGTHPAGIEVVHPLDEHGRAFGAQAWDLLEPSGGGSAFLRDADVGLRVDSMYRGSEFYRDFYIGAHELQRRDWTTTARYRATSKDYVSASHRSVVMTGVMGDPDQNWRDSRYNVGYARTVGSYNVGGSFGYQSFDFAGTTPYFDGQTQSWGLNVGPSRDGRTLLAGSFSVADTHLKGIAASPETTTASISGFRQVTDDLSVSGDLRLWDLDNSIATNTYAKREESASIEGEYTGLWRSTLRAGFETAQVDYVNRFHTEVVEPTVNTTTVALRSRPLRDVKVQVDWRSRRVDARPLAFTMGMMPVATRIWSKNDMLRLRGTWTPSSLPIGVTGGYQTTDRKNPQQGTSNEITTSDVTAWWQVSDELTATTTLMDQNFSLSGIALATPFVTDMETWQVGATWTPRERTSLSAFYSAADSFGGVEYEQNTWSFAVDHGWDEHKVKLGVTLDDLNDFNGTLLGYDADLWYAEFSTRLP
ncbi:MAG TPA: hypothetical protein QGH10_02185 [Armatimonadota bacterium]|nr:hypothetical protein [Armatimonadota bacterium]